MSEEFYMKSKIILWTLFVLGVYAVNAFGQTVKNEVSGNGSTTASTQTKVEPIATPTPPDEVEKLRKEVSELRAQLESLRKLVEEKNAAEAKNNLPTSTEKQPEQTVSGTTQSTAVNDNPKVAVATKAQGGDLSGAGNLLRTDLITIGGYGEMQYRDSSISERADGGGTPTFITPRFVLGIAATLSEKQNIVFNSEIEYEFGSREIDVEQAFVEWKARPEFALRGGIFTPSIGRFNVYHDSNLNLTAIRPLINQFIVPTAYRDTGIGIRGRFKLPRKMKLSYEFDVVNGMQGTNADGQATPFSRLLGQSSAAEPGAISFQDNNRNKAVVGRVGFSPLSGFEFGVSGYNGRFTNEGEAPISANIVFLDGSYRRGNLAINAEYGCSNIVGGGIKRRSDAPPVVNVNDSESIQALADFVAARTPGQDGFYVEGSYQFRPSFVKKFFDDGGYIAPVVRYEVVRLDRTLKDFYLNRARTTLGLNVAPSSTVILKLNYLFNRTFGPVPDVPAGIGGAIFGISPAPHVGYGRNGFTSSITYVF
ncbi:MAG: OprO/OprP family phosphate-selective porin [Acidobacteriota bacterium]|nr:OprO/OprP family phosphate-selective porin [Acidobacteriota bacterium]